MFTLFYYYQHSHLHTFEVFPFDSFLFRSLCPSRSMTISCFCYPLHASPELYHPWQKIHSKRLLPPVQHIWMNAHTEWERKKNKKKTMHSPVNATQVYQILFVLLSYWCLSLSLTLCPLSHRHVALHRQPEFTLSRSFSFSPHFASLFLLPITRYKLTTATHVSWTCITSDIQCTYLIQRNIDHHKSFAYSTLASFHIRYSSRDHLSALRLTSVITFFSFICPNFRFTHRTQPTVPTRPGLFSNLPQSAGPLQVSQSRATTVRDRTATVAG